MTIRPFVLIGLGGTGGKTLSVVYDTLSQRLGQAGIRSWPKSWQLLHVDVAAQPDPVAAGMPGMLPRQWYHALTSQSSTYPGIDHSVDQGLARLSPLDRHLVWNSWRPFHPDNVPVTIHKGAGQYRALGRVALQADLARVTDRIQLCFDEINRAPANELRAVQVALGEHPQDRSGSPVVFVIGSVAGGTGSGMLLDICDLIRACRQNRPNAVVFTPEVFEIPGVSPDNGLAPNTFMAMNELANAMWTFLDEDTHRSRDELFARGRVTLPIGQGGPETVLLVGRGSSHFAMASPEEVYKVVGRALGELMLDESLSSDVDAFLSANGPHTAAGNPDHLRLGPDDQQLDYAHFRAMGFGRLTLGRDLFERYAVQRFLRLGCERLLYHHRHLRTRGDDRTDLEILTAATDLAWPRFLVDSKLAEVNPANVVTDTLRPAPGSYVQQVRTQILADLDAHVDSRGRVATLAAQEVVRNAFSGTDEDTGVFARLTQELNGKAHGWWRSIQDHLSDLVVRTISQHGLPVTHQLLMRLKAEVLAGAAELTEREAPQYETSVQTMLAALATVNPDSVSRFKIEDTDAVEDLLLTADGIVQDIVRERTARLAGELLADLAVNLLDPWAEAVDDARSLLARRLEPSTGVSELRIWPGSEGVPEHLCPSRVELSLDPVDGFPAVFDELVTASVQNTEDIKGSRVNAAVTEVLAAEGIPAHAATAPVVEHKVGWVPREEAVRDPYLQVSRASIRLHLGVPDLQERAFAWMRDGQKTIGVFLQHTLGDWLTDSAVNAGELDRRQEVLRSQFTQLLRVSPPLVRIDNVLHNELHGTPGPQLTSYAGALNVPSHLRQLRDDLRNIQTTETGGPPTLQFTETGSSSIQVVSFIRTPVHIVEVESIMGPITREWLGNSGRATFWKYRRARPLSEWVPLSPQARRNLVLGWLTARLLGAARTDWAGDTLRLQINMGDGWVSLPAEAARPIRANQAIGSLLELLPIQFLECYNTRTTEPLEVYRWLIRRGSLMQPYRSSAGPERLNPLARLVRSGQGIVDPSVSKIGPLASTESEREAAVLAEIESLRLAYDGDVADARLANVDQASWDVAIEIYSDITWALGVMAQATRDVAVDQDR